MTGRYEIGDEVGRGATSVVHRGRDLRLQRDVAVKVLRADRDHDSTFRSRFRRRAADAAGLNHPAIVAVYDTGELPAGDDRGSGEPFVVMEWVDGRTLRAELTAQGPPPIRRSLEIVADVCAALDFSHKHGILHRAVRPEKVMLDQLGSVKVMDFGMLPPVASGDGSSAGAAGYLSPEQARGEPVDARSDVYGTGCLLYELLTGTVPFTGDDPIEVAYRQVGEPVRPPSELAASVPAGLDAIVLKALAKDPLDRYQSAADLRADLSRVRVGAPALAAAGGSMRNPVGPIASPPLLAPPTRTRTIDDDIESAEPRPSRRIAASVGFGVVSVLMLAAAIWLTMGVVTAPPPNRPIAVPDLSGMPADQARQVLVDKGLTIGVVTEMDSTSDETGKVLQQRPSGRTEVDGGTPVNLVVGRGVSVVVLPDLVGMTPDKARSALSAVGLSYAEQHQPSSDPDKGKVLAQSPAAHQPAPPGSAVTATVGTGLPMVTMPDGIVGVSVDEATGILAGAGLAAVGVEQDGTQPVGVVIATDYSPGQRVPEGSPITLNYSNNALMVMPNLVGRGRDAAASLLRDQGWAGDAGTIRTTSAPATAADLIGAVVTQQPGPGAVVRKLGTAVSVGIGVKQITMPALVGRTRAQAENLLRAAGATQVTFTDGGTAPRGQNGRVVGQSIPGGTAITADTRIVVVVYR
ncbi:MAG TPA: Stk1 family PASTA domain-containing Ser/Thr kinase [Nakamurella sp.]